MHPAGSRLAWAPLDDREAYRDVYGDDRLEGGSVSLTTYQTIKLGKGRHESPDQGVCVMELASMLAEEPFSDHPAAVCPVIGSFLRAYNDSIDDDRRQDLYDYAAKVVGSRAPGEVEAARATRLSAWAADLQRRRRRFLFPRRMRTFNWGVQVEGVGARAVRELIRSGHDGHKQALAVIDDLLTIGALAPTPGRPNDEAPEIGAGTAGELTRR